MEEFNAYLENRLNDLDSIQKEFLDICLKLNKISLNEFLGKIFKAMINELAGEKYLHETLTPLIKEFENIKTEEIIMAYLKIQSNPYLLFNGKHLNEKLIKQINEDRKESEDIKIARLLKQYYDRFYSIIKIPIEKRTKNDIKDLTEVTTLIQNI